MKRRSQVIGLVLLWVLVALSSMTLFAQDTPVPDATQEVIAADPTEEADAQVTAEPTKEVIFVPVDLPDNPSGGGGSSGPLVSTGFDVSALIDLVTGPWKILFLTLVAVVVVGGGILIWLLKGMKNQGNVAAEKVLEGLKEGGKYIPLDLLPKFLREFRNYARSTPDNQLDDFLSDGATGVYESLTGTDIDSPPDSSPGGLAKTPA